MAEPRPSTSLPCNDPECPCCHIDQIIKNWEEEQLEKKLRAERRKARRDGTN